MPVGLALPLGSADHWVCSEGIGVIFDTRKGYFRYKISSYIVIYHNALIVYHCVSLCINVVYTIYHVPRRHMIYRHIIFGFFFM